MNHQGYGFVEFMGEDDADYAIKVMNMIKLYGKPIRVNKVRITDLLKLTEAIRGSGRSDLVGSEAMRGCILHTMKDATLCLLNTHCGRGLGIARTGKEYSPYPTRSSYSMTYSA